MALVNRVSSAPCLGASHLGFLLSVPLYLPSLPEQCGYDDFSSEVALSLFRLLRATPSANLFHSLVFLLR